MGEEVTSIMKGGKSAVPSNSCISKTIISAKSNNNYNKDFLCFSYRVGFITSGCSLRVLAKR
jgi:hypothetical protein